MPDVSPTGPRRIVGRIPDCCQQSTVESRLLCQPVVSKTLVWNYIQYVAAVIPGCRGCGVVSGWKMSVWRLVDLDRDCAPCRHAASCIHSCPPPPPPSLPAQPPDFTLLLTTLRQHRIHRCCWSSPSLVVGSSERDKVPAHAALSYLTKSAHLMSEATHHSTMRSSYVQPTVHWCSEGKEWSVRLRYPSVPAPAFVLTSFVPQRRMRS